MIRSHSWSYSSNEGKCKIKRLQKLQKKHPLSQSSTKFFPSLQWSSPRIAFCHHFCIHRPLTVTTCIFVDVIIPFQICLLLALHSATQFDLYKLINSIETLSDALLKCVPGWLPLAGGRHGNYNFNANHLSREHDNAILRASSGTQDWIVEVIYSPTLGVCGC